MQIPKVQYAVKRTRHCDKFTQILDSSGGLVEIHHNGINFVSTYFQDRIEGAFTKSSWLKLADSKQYCKDWDESKTKIDQEMIDDALEWLNVFCKDFEKVNFKSLKNILKK